ncbi:STAS domain-containing protein [Streptomyces sp. NPDC054842]
MQRRAHPAQLMTGDGHVSAGPAVPPRAGGPPQPTVRAVPAGDRTVVTVSGDIDMDTEETLEQHLVAALAGSVGGVDVDMGGVGFCDCSALNVLLRLRRRALEDGRTVVVRTPGAALHRLLSITGTAPLFTRAGEGERSGGSGAADADPGAARPAGGEPEPMPGPAAPDAVPHACAPDGAADARTGIDIDAATDAGTDAHAPAPNDDGRPEVHVPAAACGAAAWARCRRDDSRSPAPPPPALSPPPRQARRNFGTEAAGVAPGRGRRTGVVDRGHERA